jgi:hypothetical protein
VAAALGRVDVEVLGQRVDVRREEAGVHQAAVHEDERVARTVLVVPRLDLTQLHVRAHGFLLWSLGICKRP